MFDGIFEAIEEWMREFLTGMVTSNLTEMFSDVNEKTGEIAAQVGQTPQGWNGSIFSLIQNLSNSVIVPIAGMIITFVLCYELISMLTEKNSMHEIDTWMFFKYFFKMWVAVYLVSNTFTIAMAVFDVGQHVVSAAGGAINAQTAINIDTMIEAMETAMESMEIGELVVLALETMLVSLCMKIMSVLITVLLYGRMIEIYLYTSVAPIPFATFSNREWGAGGEQLFPWASGAWVPGVLYDGVRRHLCGAGVNHSDFRQHALGAVRGGGIYRNPMLQPDENKRTKQGSVQCTLDSRKEDFLKIGLIDVDSHNWPNLCLMKLSAYHKAQGDSVEWWKPEGWYDVVYKSRVFTDIYSKDTFMVENAGEVIRGGTGYGLKENLPDAVEHSYPDYSLYPQFPDTAYGFLSRGCPRNCGFCIVSGKEGRRSVQVADLSEFWDGQKEIKLMDANLLACPEHEKLIQQLAESRAWVDFSQGLDIRLINPDNVSLLNQVRTKMVHFAWDNPDEDLTGYFQRFLELTAVKDKRKRQVYVLTNYGSSHEQDLYRVETLRDMGFSPYVMVYDRPSAPKITRQLQRWVNNKRIFYTVKDFADYAAGRKEAV